MMLTDRQLQSLRNLGNESEEAADDIVTLRAALEALRKDAERYRWLRLQNWFSSKLCVVRDPKLVMTDGIGLGADCPSNVRLDAAIDAAMTKEAP